MALSDPDDYDLHIKLLMLGDQGVGKTCMMMRYAFESFNHTFISTLGIDFKTKHVDLDGARVKLQIWDTAGQEGFRAMMYSYYKGAHGIVLVYDVTDRDTFASISDWFEQIKLRAEARVTLTLVGNKCDNASKRVVQESEGLALASAHGARFFETSALNDVNVEACYLTTAREVKERLLEEGSVASEGTLDQEKIDVGVPDLQAHPAGGSARCCSIS